jgi:hypothetical protein
MMPLAFGEGVGYGVVRGAGSALVTQLPLRRAAIVFVSESI